MQPPPKKLETTNNPMFEPPADHKQARTSGSIYRMLESVSSNVVDGKRMLLIVVGGVVLLCVCMFCMAFGAYEMTRESSIDSSGAMINLYGEHEAIATGAYHELSDEPISARDDDSLFRSLNEYTFDLVPDRLRVTLRTSGFMRVPCAGCSDTDSVVHIFTDQGVLVVGDDETVFEANQGSPARAAAEALAEREDKLEGVVAGDGLEELSRLDAQLEDDERAEVKQAGAQRHLLMDAQSKFTDIYCDQQKDMAARTRSAFTFRIRCTSCSRQRDFERRYCCQKAWCGSTAAPAAPAPAPQRPPRPAPKPPTTRTSCKCRWVRPPYRPPVRKCYGSGC